MIPLGGSVEQELAEHQSCCAGAAPPAPARLTRPEDEPPTAQAEGRIGARLVVPAGNPAVEAGRRCVCRPVPAARVLSARRADPPRR